MDKNWESDGCCSRSRFNISMINLFPRRTRFKSQPGKPLYLSDETFEKTCTILQWVRCNRYATSFCQFATFGLRFNEVFTRKIARLYKLFGVVSFWDPVLNIERDTRKYERYGGNQLSLRGVSVRRFCSHGGTGGRSPESRDRVAWTRADLPALERSHFF